MKRAVALASVALLLLAAAPFAGAQSLWRKVAEAKSSNSFAPSANFQASINVTHHLKVVSTASAVAHVSGTVNCKKGFSAASSSFDYRAKKATRTLKVPVPGGFCTVFGSIQLQSGGSVDLVLYSS
ncbi:MAG TPA: hypothetical protein VFJ91_01590 [Gaiellaceae bacterium]|jgi:hypothetical protein|nr:hypothetical protein [Gaiellaceae bacterium]